MQCIFSDNHNSSQEHEMVSTSGRAIETGFLGYWTSKVCRSSPMWKIQKQLPDLLYKKRNVNLVNFAQFLRTCFYRTSSGRLSLKLKAEPIIMSLQDNDTGGFCDSILSFQSDK